MWSMTDAGVLRDALQAVADRADEDMSERDVENLFLEQGFYDALDYEGTGVDIRSEFTLADDRRPDYITLDTNEAVTAVYEFKTTGRALPEHESQLFHYMDYLRAEYGVLTNGEEFRLYRRGDRSTVLTVSTDAVTESQARDLVSALGKREFDLTDPEQVSSFLDDLDPIPLDERADLGQEHFFDTFRLEPGSPFADLVTGMLDLLHELRDEREAPFVEGAYDFWEATYASDPDEMPDSWEEFTDTDGSLRDFMFCLESGHALLARLLLAKATEDHEFFVGTGYGGMADYFRGLQGFGDEINLDAFPVAADNLIDDMQDQLVEGLFQDDIFVWWIDGYQEQLSRGHETGPNQFEAVAKEESGLDRISDATRDRFSRAVAEVFFNVLRFDFADVEGDLLGDLYQRYFDPETRKALGEFYTPQAVIEYIMDGVDYDRGVSGERLIDPACGSGTFLVEAVERYLADVERYEEDPDWKDHLRDLCTRPRIVGLDVHPFAVLMAQIRFVVAILPAYREAKSQDPDFTLRRLPIYRTDTLRDERELTGADLGDDDTVQMTFDAVTEDEQDVRIPVPLPVEVDEDDPVETEDGFLVRRVRMPLFDTIKLQTGVRNFGEYFAALQGVLDTVKDHMALAEEFGDDFDWTYQSGLDDRIGEYTAREYDGVEDFFAPYVDDMLENVRYLKEEHNDGRLFKMFEDTVLALVVKNYMEYDYVVGNPPYVRVQRITDRQQSYLERLYDSTDGAYDLYYLFYERGIDLLAEGGTLGYITPSQFMTADDGGILRHNIRTKTEIREVFDFRGAGVFEDALNYPAIVMLRKPKRQVEENVIQSVRVRAAYDAPPPDLDERVMSSAREHRSKERHTDQNVDVFQFDQSELGDDDWALMPPEEYEVFNSLERRAEGNVGSVTDAVFQGLRTGANGVFVVEPLDVGRVAPDQTGRTVSVQPTGTDRRYEIECDLLCPWLERDAFRRWQAEWDGKHLLIPYGPEGELIPADVMADQYPQTWEYLNDHRETLENREGGTLRGREDWYKLSRPQNLGRFSEPKLVGKEFSDSAQFIPDTGEWHFASGYGIALADDRGTETEFVAGLLNSNVADFYLKHIASIKSFSPVRAYYAYRTRYIDQIPFTKGGGVSEVNSRVRDIRDALQTAAETERFPETYLGEYDGELEYVTYEWQTRRYPVDAEVVEGDDGRFTVQAGRSDTVSDPAMYAEDREARKRRAEYVHAAVDGQNVRSGEETTIPIPRTDGGVEDLLARLETDRRRVRETDLDALEAEIDAAVYDLFDLTAEERQVVEEYLEVF
jgi:hypothetical protein